MAPDNFTNDLEIENQQLKIQLAQVKLELKTQLDALNRSQEFAQIGSWDFEVATEKLSWSDQVFRIFGLSPVNFQVTYEAFLDAVHPSDRAMVKETYNDAIGSETPYDVIHRILRPDGSVRTVRETSQDIQDSSGATVRSMGIVHDITEQNATQKELEEKERFLSTLLANIPGMVYRCKNHPDWPMEYLSEGCYAVTGYAPADLMGGGNRSYNSIIHPDDSSKIWQTIQDALENKSPFEITYRIIKASGEERWLWERGQAVFDDEDNLIALEGFITDYSTIKNEHQVRLNLERKILENQKLESLGLMAGGIAHDFNNLLSIIMGNNSLVLDELSPVSPLREYLNNVEIASQRAADLAQQMLAYSGKSQFVVENININELLLELTQMMEISISRTGSLELELGNDIPDIVGDVTQIRQVIMNLISNASEASVENHAAIKVKSGYIWCDRNYLETTCGTELMRYDDPIPEGQYTFIEVEDSGSGMDQAILDRIFEPFFSTKFTGRGLGLAATLGIIRAHKGTLQVNSKRGCGTTFKVLFPAGNLKTNRGRSIGKSSQEASWQGSGLVLLADDEMMVRKLTKTMLEKIGFEVITAENGLDAVRQFKKRADEISLVLLDLTMPVMNGQEAFQEIIALNPEAKVILCSGYSELDLNHNLEAGKFVGSLHKPFSIKEMRQLIKQVLS